VDRFTEWLAVSPWASLLKIILPQVAVLVAEQGADLGLPPAAVVLVGAVLTIIINALNPSDPRYGMLTQPDAGDE